jgi:hypothetical protein
MDEEEVDDFEETIEDLISAVDGRISDFYWGTSSNMCQIAMENARHKLLDYHKKLYWAEQNRDRFQNHLDTIANYLGLEWWDGDFPVDKFKETIDDLKKNKS